MSAVSGSGFRYRGLSAEQAAVIRAARDAGVRVADLASAYGVSVRSVYRALHRSYYPRREVIVDEWVAVVEITPDGPVLVTRWLPL